jgi:ABC-type xylose transport system permease subunit
MVKRHSITGHKYVRKLNMSGIQMYSFQTVTVLQLFSFSNREKEGGKTYLAMGSNAKNSKKILINLRLVYVYFFIW